MKNLYLTFLIVSICILTSCDLVRDNILDGKNNQSTQNGVALKYSSCDVVYDDNGDGIINKGETVYLKVYLTNNGTSTANGVKASFSTTSSNVSLFSPNAQVSYGDISAGSTQYGQTSDTPDYSDYYTIKFTVSSSTPNNTQIPINITITDGSGNTWTSSFNLTVQSTSAQIAYSSSSVVYDNNGDGIINKGETVYLKVYLTNNGTSTANSVKASFSTTSSNVSLFSPIAQVSYGNISAGATQYGQTSDTPDYSDYYTIKFTVSSSTPNNTQIPINITITDGSGNTWTSSFNVIVQSTSAKIAYSSSSVVYDNNGDGIINKGETVYLKVYLANNGTSNANSVKASFSTTSSYVSVFSPTAQVSYGDISAGSTQYGQTSDTPDYSDYYTIKFTVSTSTPNNTQIPININITDESGNTWTSSLNVIVQSTSAKIAYSSSSVVYDNNGDGIINKGETVYLSVYLANNGTSTANGVKASFSTTSSYVSVFSPTAQVGYGDISAGSTQYGQTSDTPDYSNSYTIKFNVSISTPSSTQIPININITDGSGNTWTDSFNVTVY